MTQRAEVPSNPVLPGSYDQSKVKAEPLDPRKVKENADKLKRKQEENRKKSGM